jgi:hypothetical protein
MKEGIATPASQPAQFLKWGEFKESSILGKIENQVGIKAYKCDQCGYIELFAK